MRWLKIRQCGVARAGGGDAAVRGGAAASGAGAAGGSAGAGGADAGGQRRYFCLNDILLYVFRYSKTIIVTPATMMGLYNSMIVHECS